MNVPCRAVERHHPKPDHTGNPRQKGMSICGNKQGLCTTNTCGLTEGLMEPKRKRSKLSGMPARPQIWQGGERILEELSVYRKVPTLPPGYLAHSEISLLTHHTRGSKQFKGLVRWLNDSHNCPLTYKCAWWHNPPPKHKHTE